MSYWAVKLSEPKVSEVTVPELTSSDLKVAVAKYRSDKDVDSTSGNRVVKVLNYEAVPLVGHKGFHLRVMYRVDEEQFSVKFLLKLVRDSAHKTEKETFRKELIFFGCIMPKVLHFLPYHQSRVPVPNCFLARSRDQETLRQSAKSSPCCLIQGTTDLVIVEDLLHEGYETCLPPYSTTHLKLSIKALAQLHGLSVYLNRRGAAHNLSIPQSFPALVPETFYSKRFNPTFYTQVQLAIQIFSAIGPHLNQEMLVPGKDVSQVVRLMMTSLWDILEDIMKPSANHLNALCVVDCDPDNFVFSYDGNRNPTSCKIIKFHHTKYTRPITDLVTLLYNCSKGRYSSDEYQHLVDYYHEEFLSTFNKCHTKYHPTLPMPAGLLSMQELQETLAECRLLGAAHRAIMTSFGCLLNFADQDAEEYIGHVDPEVPMHHLVWQMFMENRIVVPQTLEQLKSAAEQAVTTNPHFRAAIFESLSDLLICLSARTFCELPEPHIKCPHPKPGI